MAYLIVYAHPNTCCFCPKILEVVKRRLNQTKQSYELIDLYALKFNPVLPEKEHYTAGNHKIGADVKKFQEQIKIADHLIFIYPIWWGSMPAILKGWFDRVLTPGFAFEYESGLPKRLLKNKKATIFTTSGGPRAYYFLTRHCNQKLIKRDILWFCGIKSLVYQIYSARKLTLEQELKIEKLVKRVLA